jgi:hypothetical protein
MANMKLPFRQALADSHVSAVAIALLLVWSLSWAVQAFEWPFLRLVHFLATAVAVVDVPHIPGLDVIDRYMLLYACFFFFNAATTVAAAWILSRWVYGEGPVSTVSRYRGRLAGKTHV